MRSVLFVALLAGFSSASWFSFRRTETVTPSVETEITEAVNKEPVSVVGETVTESNPVKNENTEVTEAPQATPSGWSWWPLSYWSANPASQLSEAEFEVIQRSMIEEPAATLEESSDEMLDLEPLFGDIDSYVTKDEEQTQETVKNVQEPTEEAYVEETTNLVSDLTSESPAQTESQPRKRHPAVKHIRLTKTATIADLARYFDELCKDPSHARYSFTGINPTLKKRIIDLARVYGFAILSETTRTLAVKRIKMNRTPDRSAVQKVVVADSNERAAALSSRAYFGSRAANPVSETRPLNRKGRFQYSDEEKPVKKGRAAKGRRGASRLHQRERKQKAAAHEATRPEIEQPSWLALEERMAAIDLQDSSKTYPMDNKNAVRGQSSDFFEFFRDLGSEIERPEEVYHWQMDDETFDKEDGNRRYDGSSSSSSSSSTQPTYNEADFAGHWLFDGEPSQFLSGKRYFM